jgi:hypothetical protein
MRDRAMGMKPLHERPRVVAAATKLGQLQARHGAAAAELEGARQQSGDTGEIKRLVSSGADDARLEKLLSARAARLARAEAVHAALAEAVKDQERVEVEEKKAAALEMKAEALPGHQEQAKVVLEQLKRLLAEHAKLVEIRNDLERATDARVQLDMIQLNPQLVSRLANDAVPFSEAVALYASRNGS